MCLVFLPEHKLFLPEHKFRYMSGGRWLCMHVCVEICLIYASTAADLKCDLAYFMVIMCQMKTAAAGQISI